MEKKTKSGSQRGGKSESKEGRIQERQNQKSENQNPRKAYWCLAVRMVDVKVMTDQTTLPPTVRDGLMVSLAWNVSFQ